MEHIPVAVKLEDVPDVTIYGICCSESGLLFMVDKTRNMVYRLDTMTCSSFSFGEGKMSKYFSAIESKLYITVSNQAVQRM